MTDQRPPAGAPAPVPDRLDSWKDIAAYLKRDVSTVQRWEKRERMPVHRHLHDKLGSVYAYPAELDEWARSRRAAGASKAEAVDVPDAPRRSPRHIILILALAAVAIILFGYGLRRYSKATSPNPIASARFVPITDFEGREVAAAISRDGRFVAFLSDRDGPIDVWLTQVGSGQFRNLTGGRLRELINPDIRMLGFSPDGTFVAIWVRRPPGRPSDISIWSVPTLGGEPRLLFEGAAEMDWTRDGTRVVYHTPAPGDPMFIREAAGGEARHLFTASAGIHNHYPRWSPDDAFIYYVGGPVPLHQDIWRIPARGGTPERMTTHDTRVSHLAFLDAQTLVYLATDAEGAGPWLYALDIERRATRRISFGVERYESVAASADGTRLAVSVANSRRTLWRVPLDGRAVTESAAQRIPLAVLGGRSPRSGPGYLLYVSSHAGGEALWKFAEGSAAELWSAPGARIIGGAAISPDGRRVAFTAEQKGVFRLYAMNTDGSGLRPIATKGLRVRGEPTWSPDGASLAIAAMDGAASLLATIDVANGRAAVIRREVASDPAWSIDGTSILYSGAEVGTTFPIREVALGGRRLLRREITLSRGVRRIVFIPQKNAIVVLRGDMVHKNFWEIDLDTGSERQLTDFGRDVVIGDFDISPDGREIVFDREQDTSDIVLIER